MCVQQDSEERLKALLLDSLRFSVAQQLKEPSIDIQFLQFQLPVVSKSYLRDLACLSGVNSCEQFMLEKLGKTANFGSDFVEFLDFELRFSVEGCLNCLFVVLEDLCVKRLPFGKVELRDLDFGFSQRLQVLWLCRDGFDLRTSVFKSIGRCRLLLTLGTGYSAELLAASWGPGWRVRRLHNPRKWILAAWRVRCLNLCYEDW